MKSVRETRTLFEADQEVAQNSNIRCFLECFFLFLLSIQYAKLPNGGIGLVVAALQIDISN